MKIPEKQKQRARELLADGKYVLAVFEFTLAQAPKFTSLEVFDDPLSAGHKMHQVVISDTAHAILLTENILSHY